MLAAVRRSQRDFDNALAQVEDLRALRRGHVRVGVSHATAEYLLPLVIASLHGRYPGITFSVRSGTGEELLRGVAQGEIDVAYCLRRPPPPGVQEVRAWPQSEEHTSELQSQSNLVCRLLLEKKNHVPSWTKPLLINWHHYIYAGISMFPVIETKSISILILSRACMLISLSTTFLLSSTH